MDAKDAILIRMYAALTALCLLPLLVVGQVFRIHLTEGGDLRDQGERQTNAFVGIPAMRGAIYDRAGRTLAVNTARYDLAIDPTVSGFDAQRDAFFERLSKLTGASAAHYRQRVRERASPQYAPLVRGLSEEQKEEALRWETPGVILDPAFARRYNHGQTASHVLGYVNSDGIGLSGLELQYDEHLRGVDGRRPVQRNRLGRIRTFVSGNVVEPVHGESLVLTIDLLRQTILEEELARGVAEMEALSASAVALDPRTGAVLALANAPAFDPNRAGAYPAALRRNRVITDRMEPGSTFKLVSAVSAIEQGLVQMEEVIETGDGWAVVHGRTFTDTRARGAIPFREVISLSSNVGTAKVVSRADRDAFYAHARRFGFGQRTGIDLPGEVQGSLKPPDEWSAATLTAMGIGYEVDVTLLQTAVAYAALANGGRRVAPHVVAERRDVTGRTTWKAPQDSVRRAFRSSTAETILPAFLGAVERGTATRAQIAGLKVAGKTGTSLKAEDGGYREDAYRASFAGFFPADDPQIVLVVAVDEPQTFQHGGQVAAPIFQRAAARWLATFPELSRQAFSAAQRAPEVAADESAVARPVSLRNQSETEAASLAAHALPDFRGWTMREAAHWLSRRNIPLRIEGKGVVSAQYPEAGHPPGQTVVLQSR